MAENEANVISHLLNVEAQASDLVKEAQDEADKRLSSAHTKADAEFKEKFSRAVAELEKNYSARLSSIDENHNKMLEEYKSSVINTEQNKDDFNLFLKQVLIGQ